MCCWRPHFEGLLQLKQAAEPKIAGCWRPHFEGLLQQMVQRLWTTESCWRPHFEGLLQHCQYTSEIFVVVEDPILRGYYNSSMKVPLPQTVVEDPILRGYYNGIEFCLLIFLLLKTPFWGVITTESNFTF